MKISVIIPAFNSEQYIRDCLDSLRKQSLSADEYEIIVVDNGSADRTVEIAQSLGVKVVPGPQLTVSALRNLGAAQAQGDILAFVDSDCCVAEDWLRLAVELIGSKGAAAIGYWYRLPHDLTWVERVWDLHMSLKRVTGYVPWLPSSNFFIRKSVFEKISGFNPQLVTGEDSDICNRIILSGEKIYSDDRLAVTHMNNPKTVVEFFRKEIWHGLGGLQRFIREFPRYIFDKSIIQSLVNLICLAGIVAACLLQNVLLFFLFAGGIFCIPLMMALRLATRSHDFGAFVLSLSLYLVYGLARTVSFLNVKLWIEEIKRTRHMTHDT